MFTPMEVVDCIEKTRAYAQALFAGEASGHDWWHILRVWRMSQRLARQIAQDGSVLVDFEIVELSALLHDVDDWKLSLPGHSEAGTDKTPKARAWLRGMDYPEDRTAWVCDIIHALSFKGAGVPDAMHSIEGKIVQDADRLDAIGAIGIARTFAFGGAKGRNMYDPAEPPQLHQSFGEYKAKQSHTINHFYEKLLLLKDRLNTSQARTIAVRRHALMESFLASFLAEWDGED